MNMASSMHTRTMTVDFKRTQVKFRPAKGREQSELATVRFDYPVYRAEAVLAGFDIQFSDGEHAFKREMIETSRLRINGNEVEVEVRLLLRDASGDIDDNFDGVVDIVIIAGYF